jgi:hypothetical protein
LDNDLISFDIMIEWIMKFQAFPTFLVNANSPLINEYYLCNLFLNSLNPKSFRKQIIGNSVLFIKLMILEIVE